MSLAAAPTGRSWLNEVAFHPVLLAAYPVLHLYSVNSDQTDLKTVFLPLLLIPSLAALLWGLLRLVAADSRRAALMTSLAALLFFSYGHVLYLIYSPLIRYEIDAGSVHGGSLTLKSWVSWGLSGIWLLLLAYGGYRAATLSEARLPLATRLLNTLALVLLAMPLLSLLGGVLLRPADHDPRAAGTIRGSSAQQGQVRYRPDIYFIVLDGYARADVLQRHFDFDNSAFLDGLRARGFSVSEESYANYNWTFLSLSSTLNMKHLEDYPRLLGRSSRDRGLAYREIRDSAVSGFLRERGYRYVHLTSTWGATLHNPFADVEINCAAGAFKNELYRVIGESTWLNPWSTRVGGDLARCHLANLESLAKLAPMRGPKFVFAHFIPPHHPYLFDRDGNILRNATVSNQFEFQKKLWRDKGQYIDQLVYMSTRIEGVIDSILEESGEPPVIILVSDHGPQVGEPARQWQRSRLANLAAFYLPGADGKQLMPRSVNSINIFVRLFNHYFDADLELREKRYYWSPYRRPYRFTEARVSE